MRLQEYSKKTKLFIFVTMSIPSIALGAEPIEIGRNAAVKGTVEVLSQEQEQARLAIIKEPVFLNDFVTSIDCLLYTSPSPRDQRGSRMPSSA